MEYPKWKYHAEIEARIVQSEAEEKALGSDWGNSPADFGVITYPTPEQKYEMEKAKLNTVKEEKKPRKLKAEKV